jgi:putative endonuclease
VADPINGAQAEALACSHLERAGLKLVARNYRCPQGEVDLIMDDHDTLVFVEVRYRRSVAFGTPAETVDRRKQARLQAAASHYLLTQHADCVCRFDVVAVSGRDARIEWLRDAFGAAGL